MNVHKWMNWYEKNQKFLQDTFGADWQLVAALLAATSPQVQLQTNWQWTIVIYNQYRTGRKPDLKMLHKCHRKNVHRALAGERLQGRKVQAFYAALCGDKNAVVLDIWMLRLFKFYPQHSHNPQGKRYDRLAECFRITARCVGLPPAELQSALWTHYRVKHGFKPIDYCIVAQNNRQMELFEEVPF